MNTDIEESRRRTLDLLEETRCLTRSTLSKLDPERVVHNDERAWRVRDVIGHLGVWNGEAARSLEAYVQGGEYHCVPTDEYYEYNGPAADERRGWSMEQVWAEYEASHEQLKSIITNMPVAKWGGEVLFPWNAHGTVEQLIKIMMRHETHDHCDLILRVNAAKPGP